MLRRNGKTPDPRCWWQCGTKLDPGRTVHYTTPDPTLPTGTGHAICGPGCPSRPIDGIAAGYEPNWWTHHPQPGYKARYA